MVNSKIRAFVAKNYFVDVHNYAIINWKKQHGNKLEKTSEWF